MKYGSVFIMMVGFAFCRHACGSVVSIETSVRDLYDLVKPSGCSKEGFLIGMTNGVMSWGMCTYDSMSGVASEDLSRWYATFVHSVVSATSDFEGTNRWLFAKANLLSAISFNPAVLNSTNCMVEAAIEMGKIRDGLRSRDDWYELRGIAPSDREVRPDGVVVVRVAGLFSDEQRRRDDCARKLQSIQREQERIAETILGGYHEFVKSPAFNFLSPESRNELVSNIVDAARFMPSERTALGLTNSVPNLPGAE